MAVQKLQVESILYDVQSIGFRSGTPNVFISFGYSDFIPRRHGAPPRPASVRLAVRDVIRLALACCEMEPRRRIGCVLAGHEPACQVTAQLVWELVNVGFRPVAIETAGTICVDGLGLDWVTLVPRPGGELRQSRADEVVATIGPGGDFSELTFPDRAERWYVVPRMEGSYPNPVALAAAVGWVKRNPEWRLCVRRIRA